MMDAQHAMMMERVGEGILQAAQAEECRLDAQLASLETLGKNYLARSDTRLNMSSFFNVIVCFTAT